jgi:hypothetical protein
LPGSGKEARLKQKRLHKVFQRGWIFSKGRAKGFNAHWATIVDIQQSAKIVSIKRIETVTIDALQRQG